MQLTDPTYLWALLGLLVPLAIHLLSRKAGRVVKVGSIRHLVDANPRKFSSLRFNEFWLFLLRALAVILFVLLLTGLTREGRRELPQWILLEGEAGAVPGLQKRLDSLQEHGYELRYLTEGFPLIADGPFPKAPGNYAYLLQELETRGVEAVIYAQNRLTAFRGRQQPLPEKVRWLQLPTRAQDTILRAGRMAGDTVLVQSASTGPDRTEFFNFTTQVPVGRDTLIEPEISVDPVPIEPLPAIRIALLTDGALRVQQRTLEAALMAIRTYSGRQIIVDKLTADSTFKRAYDAVINLITDRKMEPDAPAYLHLKSTNTGNLLSRTGNRTWAIRPDLDRQSALREDLLTDLGAILFQDDTLTEKIRNWDRRTIDESTFFNGTIQSAEIGQLQPIPLDRWLLLALAIVFIFERILAFYRQA